MHQAAFVAIHTTPHAQYYNQTKRNQGKNAASPAPQSPAAAYNLILTTLKNQTPYNPKPALTNRQERPSCNLALL